MQRFMGILTIAFGLVYVLPRSESLVFLFNAPVWSIIILITIYLLLSAYGGKRYSVKEFQ